VKSATPQIETRPALSPWLRRAAICLACATFPLIFVGGLVTTTRAGMAVPDWPSTYGYNLFLYPWVTWFFGPWKLFVEHGHRLFGSLVGLFAIGLLAIAIWTKAPRGYVMGAVVTLVLVCLQGFLGGARVLLESRGILDGRSIAMIHGCVGPIFFTYAVLYAVATSSRPIDCSALRSECSLSTVKAGSLLLALLAIVQLFFGASLRHVPDTAEPSYFKIMTLMHLIFAAALLVQSLLLSARIMGRKPLRQTFGGSASILLTLLVAQIALGIATWVLKYGYPPSLPLADYFAALTIEHQSLIQVLTVTAHVANGSLVLALATRLVFVARRYQSIMTSLAALVLAEGLS
jgi:heme a synthase